MVTFTPTPTQVAELRRKIEAKYMVLRCGTAAEDLWCVGNPHTWIAINDNDHDDPLDAEAEMEAIIQAEVKAAMEAANHD